MKLLTFCTTDSSSSLTCTLEACDRRLSLIPTSSTGTNIVAAGKKGSKGYYNKSQFEVVDGGTGYAVQMAIDNQKTVYVFDQDKDKWFRWSYTSLSFRELKGTPVITTENFAGIGTREIKPNGILAIQEVYNLTFN